MKKFPKKETLAKIEDFFSSIKDKKPKDIKKIKKLAANYNIKLEKYKKTFCKKCLTPYKNPKIRIRNNRKILVCKNCNNVSRYKIKTS